MRRPDPHRQRPGRSVTRRRFLGVTSAATLPFILAPARAGAQETMSRRPQDVRIVFHWRKYLALHGILRRLASQRGEVEAGYAAAVDIYRRQLFNVPGRTIWYTMESHIAVATSPAALRGQLTNVFPLAYRTYDLKPTGQQIAEAILQSVSAFERHDWPALEARRKQAIDPVLNEQFLPHLEQFMTFLLTSLNAKPTYLIQLDFNMVDRYISTGNETGMVQDRYFNIVETARFSPLGVVETIVLLMARIIEMADSNNRHGALLQLRERQEVLRLPNPTLFPRAVLYWTAGEAVKRIADPSHEHVAETLRIYQRAMRPFMPAIEEFWNPYLDGKFSLDEALNGMVRRVAEP
jgi:hypothetical protein